MPQIELSKITGVFLKDQRFTKQEGEYVTEFAKQGLIRRGDLYDSYQAIAAAPGTRVGLKAIEDYFASTAQGLERAFFVADPNLIQRLAGRGVKTPEQLLVRAAKPVQRVELALVAGVDPKALEQLASQADLLRVPGLSKKVARALVESSVKSVGQLGTLSNAVLTQKLAKRLPAGEVPSAATLTAWRAKAKALPKALEFGGGSANDKLAAWAALTPERRAERIEYEAEDDPLLTLGANRWNVDPVAYLQQRGAPASAVNLFVAERSNAVDALVDWQHGFDGGYDPTTRPEIQEYKVGTKVVASVFTFAANDGSEDLYVRFYYDHLLKRLTATLTGNTANGRSDDEWFIH
jgi:hypothetical protein